MLQDRQRKSIKSLSALAVAATLFATNAFGQAPPVQEPSSQEDIEAALTGGVPMGRWKEGLTFEGISPQPWLKSAANWFPRTEDVQPNEMRIIFMGSAPFIRPGQMNTAILVELGNGKIFMFDIGEGSPANIIASGYALNEITDVFITHLHVDHCGWNTRLDGDRWVPTFPNAQYLFSETEFRFWADPANDKVTGTGANDGCYQDSVLPVYEAGLARLVNPGDRIVDDMVFGDAGGHSPGQLTLTLEAKPDNLIFTGDLFHSPLQIPRPEWSSKFDVDRSAAAETRRQFIERQADADSVILSAHVCTPNAGRIVTHDDGRRIFRLEDA